MNNFVDYSFRMNSLTAARPRSLEVFYDAGVLWNQGQTAPVRQSAGFGYRQSVFSLALAFPFRQGRVEPVVMVGMNY
jgi:outer membrane protein assembly factor BamA